MRRLATQLAPRLGSAATAAGEPKPDPNPNPNPNPNFNPNPNLNFNPNPNPNPNQAHSQVGPNQSPVSSRPTSAQPERSTSPVKAAMKSAKSAPALPVAGEQALSP